MNWDAIGATAEALAAIGVLITLIYLAVQLKQNTAALKGSSFDNFTQRANELQTFISTQPEMMVKFLSDQELSETDQFLADRQSFMVFNFIENLYHHREAGLIDEKTFSARMLGWKNNFSAYPSYKNFWRKNQEISLYSPEFIKFVETNLLSTN